MVLQMLVMLSLKFCRLVIEQTSSLVSCASPVTSKTPEGRSATFRVQIFQGFLSICFEFFILLTSIAAQFLETFRQKEKHYFEPSRKGTPWKPFLEISFFVFFSFPCFSPAFLFMLLFLFFACVSFIFLQVLCITRGTVGRDTDQPTNQSFRVCKVNPATLKVAMKFILNCLLTILELLFRTLLVESSKRVCPAPASKHVDLPIHLIIVSVCSTAK